MRFIKNMKQLSKLNKCNIINKDLNQVVIQSLEELVVNHNDDFGGVIIIEDGDMLRGLDVFGLDTSKTGIMGINFINVILINKIIRCDYLYNNKYMILIIEKRLCDKEIEYLFNFFIEKN